LEAAFARLIRIPYRHRRALRHAKKRPRREQSPEVVWREMDDSDWTHVVPVGNVTSASFSFFPKDNFLIGVRAVDVNGHHSPVAYPTIASF
jgi:hypothetical protein